MNKVILSGNLCQPIELKKTSTNKYIVTNSIAVQREYKNANGDYDTDFINIIVWSAQAEYLSKYAHKGDRVELVGRWEVRKYQANDGTIRTVNECIVESIKAFNRKPTEETQPTYHPDKQADFEDLADDTDLPF